MAYPPVSEPLASESLTEEESTNLLESVIASSALPPKQADGIAFGSLAALTEKGEALVDIATWGLSALPAPSLVTISKEDIGKTIALGFTGGNPYQPVILGFILPSAGIALPLKEAKTKIHVDGKRVVLEAEHQIELRCGEACILLNADGRIIIRGVYVTNYACATQRILGGSVNLN